MGGPIGKLLGTRIRRIRQEKGLTLKQIESRVGVSATHVSEIERGKTSPTIKALERIAQALQVPPAYLIDLPPVSVPSVTRLRERNAVTVNGGMMHLEPLTDRLVASEMSIFVCTIQGGGHINGFPGHRGEEFCYVLKGFLEVTVDGTPQVLRPGDTMHFKATQPHHIRNLTHEPARALWAVRPKLTL